MIDKKILLVLIKGLTTYENSTQYYEGVPAIKGANYKILIDFLMKN